MRFLFAAGGTGGHIYPALAIVEELQRVVPNAEILFVGTKDRLEASLIPNYGYSFTTIWISGFRRGMHVSNILFPFRVVISMFQSYNIIRKFKPSCVIGTGGFVCGPVLAVAECLGIPTVLHESNSYPGVTTRLLAPYVRRVLLAFDETKKWLKRSANAVVVGTPTRSRLNNISKDEAVRYFNLDLCKPIVLVFGGSQGASTLNRVVAMNMHIFRERGIQLIWQTGNSEYEKYKDFITESEVYITAFIHAMEYAYAAADVVICRAGATTLAELTRSGKAAILVPYPYAAADHQRMNAQALANAGAACMILETELEKELIPKLVYLLENTEVRVTMEAACRSFGRPNATTDIVHHILEVMHTK
ncbi:MAG: undecaprenyldiphospho-muramoylpentapeptide beta-N-acetylglucosaminyltransferase [Bacteroidetes bacterium]|nr:undecaprenyldiphospho-muramoylpentapeptide beta-N-acetylglucosaminyltransferase [Bacteroidota bacterium]